MSVHLADIDAYFAWLRDRTKLRNLPDGWTEITTPYLDRHNDYIQIYGRRQGDLIELTDDGNTITDLETSGCDVKAGKRRLLLDGATKGHGVEVKGRELLVKADDRTFALKAHSLVQSILQVNDLFYTARPHVASLFLEDVTEWLNERNVRYSPRVKLAGKSGFDHYFDFIIPQSRQASERLLSAVNRPNRQAAGNFIFSWVDIRDSRPSKTEAIAIINDHDSAGASEYVSAIAQYDIVALPWSKREEFAGRLIA